MTTLSVTQSDGEQSPVMRRFGHKPERKGVTRMNKPVVHIPTEQKLGKPVLTYDDYCHLRDMHGEFFAIECRGKRYEYHHAACAGGYVSRLKDSEIRFELYTGRFGRGYRVHLPRFNSNQYHTVVYYIEA